MSDSCNQTIIHQVSTQIFAIKFTEKIDFPDILVQDCKRENKIF